jgi:hypothetical protein
MTARTPGLRAAPGAPIANRLLERLPVKDRARLLSSCEEVQLSFGEVLAEPESRCATSYFPTGSVISLLVPMDGKSHLEVAIVGAKGSTALRVALGIGTSPLLALVQARDPPGRWARSRFAASSPGFRRCATAWTAMTLL